MTVDSEATTKEELTIDLEVTTEARASVEELMGTVVDSEVTTEEELQLTRTQQLWRS